MKIPLIVRVTGLLALIAVLAIWATILDTPTPAQANRIDFQTGQIQLAGGFVIDCGGDDICQQCQSMGGTGNWCQRGSAFACEGVHWTYLPGGQCPANSSSSSSTSSTSSSASSIAGLGVPPIFAGRVPPTQTSTVFDSAAGGTAGCPGGDATATIPPGTVPGGTKVVCSKPNLNGLPNGTFRLGGVGDKYDSFAFTDANGNPITSFNPSITVCFNLSADDLANVNPYFYIDQWKNGQWVRVPFNWVAGTPNKVCTMVSSW